MASIAIIPARGASKRIPRKNIRPFLGQPIIAYTIRVALASGLFDEVMVSTEDVEIAQVAESLGAKVPFMRSSEAAGDYATTTDVLIEVLETYRTLGFSFDLACCLYPAAPFITNERLAEAFDLIGRTRADTVVTVSRFTSSIWRSFRKEGDGISFNWPEFAIDRTQDVPTAYHDAGQFYVFKPSALLAKRNLLTEHMVSIEIPPLEVHDIDEEEDWSFAELKYRHLHGSRDDRPVTVKATIPARPGAPVRPEALPESIPLAGKIGVGAAQFGMHYGISNQIGQVDRAKAVEILTVAREAGINMIDTAQAYGESEALLGDIADGEWDIYTKLPPVPEDLLSDPARIRHWVDERTQESLKRLSRAAVAGIMLHQPAQLSSDAGPAIFEALFAQRAAGHAARIGISVYGPADLEALSPEMRFDFVQGPLNILDMRLAETGWTARLADHGCAFFARSAFLQGLLVMSPEQRPKAFARWQPLWQLWDDYLARTGLTAVGACIRHLLRVPHVDRVIIGVTRMKELSEILDVLEGDLPPLPPTLQVTDTDLINPSSWAKL